MENGVPKERQTNKLKMLQAQFLRQFALHSTVHEHAQSNRIFLMFPFCTLLRDSCFLYLFEPALGQF
jgi:hypothetical protein